MPTIEDRLRALEVWIQTDYTWAAKHWQIVSLGTFAFGLVVGLLIPHL